jgi:hypothetical protein
VLPSSALFTVASFPIASGIFSQQCNFNRKFSIFSNRYH